MDNLFTNLIYLAITTALAIIGYFLKKTISDVDKKATREEFCRLSEDMDKMAEDMDKTTEKLSLDIASIKEDYITKEDFFREQAKTDRKLDRIVDILLEMKGGNGNGYK